MADPVLVARLEANIDKFEKQLGRAYALANKNTRDIENRFDKMSSNVSGGLGKVGGLLATAFATTAIAAFAKHAIEVADNIGEAADRIGISTTALQGLHYVARLTGASTEELDKAMLKLVRTIGKSDGEIDDVVRAFNKIGLRIDDLKGKKPEEIFFAIADGIKATKDPFQQAALAVSFFGDRMGQKMLPALRQGKIEIARMIAEADKMGLIIPEEIIKKAALADDEFKRLGSAWQVAGSHLSVGLLPGLTKLREVMTDPAFQEGVKNLGENIGKVIKFIADNPGALTALTGLMVGGRIAGVPGAVVGGIGGFVAGAKMATEQVESLRTHVENLNKEILDLEAKRPTFADRFGGAERYEKRLAALKQNLEETTQEIIRLSKAPTKLEVAKTPDIGPVQTPFVSEALDRQLEEIGTKTKIARGEFDQWAEGFPAFISKMKETEALFKTHGADLSKYPEQVQQVNAAMKTLENTMQMKELGKQFGQAFGTALENAVIDGKELSEVMKSLAKDIQRLALRAAVLKPLENLFGGAFGSLGSILPIPRMAGGPVSGGAPYMVGERGPELFIPNQSGRVLPNSKSGGGMMFAPVTNIDARGSQMSEAQFKLILAENNRTMLKVVAQAAPARQRRLQMLGT